MKKELENLAHLLLASQWSLEGEKKINLRLLNWTFKWNQRKRALGVCKVKYRRIELSAYVLERNPQLKEKFEDTLRHELAHALDATVRGFSDHGPHWKYICGIVGAEPERCYDGRDLDLGTAPYEVVCPKCNNTTPRFRRPKRVGSCGKCYPWAYNPAYRLEVRQTRAAASF